MSTTPKEYSPYVGPDALRQYAHLMKSFYGLHTDRFKGHQDIEGSQYEGTVENWGSEMLMESRKMYMTDPPLRNIFVENTLDYYFEIKHSHIIDTYDQQNMLVALLREDVLLSDREYRLRFDNVEEIVIPRALSSSARREYDNTYYDTTYRDKYYHTTTPPTLVISKQGEPDVEISLKLSDSLTGDTHYYYHHDIDTDIPGTPAPISGGTLLTCPYVNAYHGYPCIWICTPKLQLLPDIGLTNNEFDSKQFIVVGTNGHDAAMAYPLINSEITADADVDELKHWLVKVHSVDVDGFVDDDGIGELIPRNFTTKIDKIELMYFSDIDQCHPYNQPDSSVIITYDQEFCKICMQQDIGFDINLLDLTQPFGPHIRDAISDARYFGHWYFDKPQVRGTEQTPDYDYDGATYINKPYAFTSMLSFVCNMIAYPSTDPFLTAGFAVVFDPEYLNEYEKLCENAYSGIHVDVTSDHSDNGVSKKNGVIHNMGDFDGLPAYFSYMLDNDVHRAHVEMYSIRDQLNEYNQKATDKQTAGIIVDSGIPKNEITNVLEDLPATLYWDPTFDGGKGGFTYDHSQADIDIANVGTSITFTDPDNFGCSQMPIHMNEMKFIYHGNRYFSLGLAELDPDREYGRVYIISNDRASYDNNETSLNPKPATTFARICDIPTYFSQLVYIKGIAPTVIIGDLYTRTEASYYVSDKRALYNVTNRDRIMLANRTIAFYEYNAPSMSEMAAAYPTYTNLNGMINISSSSQVTYDISNVGSGYAIGDVCQFYIGGISIEVEITDVDSGTVTEFKFIDRHGSSPVLVDYPYLENPYQPRTNFASEITTFKPESKSGSGTNFSISMEIDSTIWGTTSTVKVSNTSDIPIYYFKIDHEGVLWVDALLDSTPIDQADWVFGSYQISGLPIYYNPYDSGHADMKDTFINDTIVPINHDFIDSDIDVVPCTSIIPKIRNTMGKNPIIHDKTDLSPYLNKTKVNIQNGLFIVDENYSTLSDTEDVIRYELDRVESNQDGTSIPTNSDLNLDGYVNKSNSLRYLSTSDDKQPKLVVYNPNKTTVDEYSDIMKDVVKVDVSNPISLKDILESSERTPEGMIDANGFIDRDIYIFDEYDTSTLEWYRNYWSELTRDVLLVMINARYPNSEPIKFEGTTYQYSNAMLVDYCMNNHFNWSDEWNDVDRPAAIYRKPEIKRLRTCGDQIDTNGIPYGVQPKGGFDTITDDVFHDKLKIGNATVDARPINIFRIDNPLVSPVTLNDCRMYDDMDNDISEISLIILNGVILCPNIDNYDKITWNPVVREQAPEEDNT